MIFEYEGGLMHSNIDTGLPHPGKVLESPGLFFAALESPWILFVSPGKSWKMFIEFSRDFPGQNVKLFFFYNNWYLVIIQSYCWNNLHFEVGLKSFIVL